MKLLSYDICAAAFAILIGAVACSRETSPQKEKAGSRVLTKERTALLFEDINPSSYPKWEIPVQAGKEYISYVTYYGDSSEGAGDSVSVVIYDPSRDEYEIFTLGGHIDSMLGHRILGMPVEDKTISIFVPKWPGATNCATGMPDHRMEGDKHLITFRQNCTTRDTSGMDIPGAKRRLEFEITVR